MRMDVRHIFHQEDSYSFWCIHDLYLREAGFSTSGKTLCYSVERVSCWFDDLNLGCLFDFVWLEVSETLSPSRTRSLRWVGGDTIHIFLEVPLLCQLSYFLLKLAVIFTTMFLDSTEFSPSSWFRSHYSSLWRRRCSDVMQVEYLTPDLLSTSIHRHENFMLSSLLFLTWFCHLWARWNFFPLRVWTLDAWDVFLDIMRILFGVDFLAFDVALNPGDHLSQGECRLLDEKLIEVFCIKSILEYPQKHFLVWWSDPALLDP